MFPKGQCPLSMYTKLKVTLREETIVSAMLRFTEKIKFSLKLSKAGV
jgi:hypothetical protein